MWFGTFRAWLFSLRGSRWPPLWHNSLQMSLFIVRIRHEYCSVLPLNASKTVVLYSCIRFEQVDWEIDVNAMGIGRKGWSVVKSCYFPANFSCCEKRKQKRRKKLTTKDIRTRNPKGCSTTSTWGWGKSAFQPRNGWFIGNVADTIIQNKNEEKKKGKQISPPEVCFSHYGW